eukprot:gb/GEZN01010837.1/.p1 GENE.gb/GEZN01010837.1/~~gb/GEZN01010837.1/.p1  ORF type:complete len:282 (-),score=47.50 gb/GEZN01010837.1/:101-946(-)
MGMGMAQRLIKSGKQVVCWNRSSNKCDDLVRLGAQVADSPREVVERCDVTYVMLTTPKVSEQVFLAPDIGTLAGLGPGKTLVECSTLDVETVVALEEAVKRRGGRFVEAPVSGSKIPAETGQLIFLCGGDKEAYEHIGDDLRVMGKASFFFGNTGKGTQMKLIVNMVMGSMLAAGAEGIALAEAAKLPADKLVEVLSLGAMNCPLFAAKLPCMANKNYATHFPLKHAQKDMRLALALGDHLNQPLPVSSAANQLYLSGRSAHGDKDFSAVREALVRDTITE